MKLIQLILDLASSKQNAHSLEHKTDGLLVNNADLLNNFIDINWPETQHLVYKILSNTDQTTGKPLQLASTPAAGQAVEPPLLAKLRVVVEANIADSEFGVPELAKAALMSHMQVYRKLQALARKTPSQFIRSIRLRYAQELLQTTELNISEAAYETGFTDPNYFSRVFRQEFGYPPSAIRKQLR
jgi:transcriptional regulator GlxA family with amidase domain